MRLQLSSYKIYDIACNKIIYKIVHTIFNVFFLNFLSFDSVLPSFLMLMFNIILVLSNYDYILTFIIRSYPERTRSMLNYSYVLCNRKCMYQCYKSSELLLDLKQVYCKCWKNIKRVPLWMPIISGIGPCHKNENVSPNHFVFYLPL